MDDRVKVYELLFCISDAMEALLEEECLREKKLREYEAGRAEVTRTLLSQLVPYMLSP
jgi:hypothetical protein